MYQDLSALSSLIWLCLGFAAVPVVLVGFMKGINWLETMEAVGTDYVPELKYPDEYWLNTEEYQEFTEDYIDTLYCD